MVPDYDNIIITLSINVCINIKKILLIKNQIDEKCKTQCVNIWKRKRRPMVFIKANYLNLKKDYTQPCKCIMHKITHEYINKNDK